MHARFLTLLTFLSSIIFTIPAQGGGSGSALDPGFGHEDFAAVPGTPTSLAWAPDGSARLFVTLQEGSVRIVKNGALLPLPFASIAAYTQGECGVLGICFDPDYATNRYVYVFVTVSRTEQRILRYTDVNDRGTARTNIIRRLPTLGENHDGGALGFGGDGRLYWAVGDLGDKRGVDGDLKSLAAKVGRAHFDGSVPADNPFHDGTGPNNDFIWATGFRNPFTLTVQPRTGKLFLNVVGSTSAGQTDPNSGPGYEQIFALNAGEDGGYDDYEGNQPFSLSPVGRTYAHPVLQYLTETSADPGRNRNVATRSAAPSGVITIATTAAHPYRVGEGLLLSGSGGYSGRYAVVSVPSPTALTLSNYFGPPVVGPDPDVATGGTLEPLVQGSSLCGGAFYESSAFPDKYRGSFFYCDFTSDRIFRAIFDGDNRAIAVLPFFALAGAPVDVAVGPDGALYYASIAQSIIRRIRWIGTDPGIVVTPTVVTLLEGNSATCAVRLGSAPSGSVTVRINASSGDTDLAVRSTTSVTFTPTNWNAPQVVTFAATPDADFTDDTAEFSAAALGYSDVPITVKATDNGAHSAVVSASSLTIPESTSATFTLSLPSAPARPVTFAIRRTAGPASAVLSAGAVTFTSTNWNVPRTIRITAKADRNALDEALVYTISAKGYFPRRLAVKLFDDEATAPVFTSTPPTTATLGVNFTYTAVARAVPPPTFSLEEFPGGMTINPTTGVVTWLPASPGIFSVKIRAENGRDPTGVQSFLLGVASP